MEGIVGGREALTGEPGTLTRLTFMARYYIN